MRMDSFDLNATIFKSVPSPLNREMLKAKLGVEPYYSSQTAKRITADFTSVVALPSTIKENASIYAFLQDECDVTHFSKVLYTVVPLQSKCNMTLTLFLIFFDVTHFSKVLYTVVPLQSKCTVTLPFLLLRICAR